MRRASREFSANDYNRSRDDYAQGWRAIDETLYHLCRDHPHHDHRPWVNAKILIIGRTYATGIERKVPDKRRLSLFAIFSLADICDSKSEILRRNQ